MSAHLDELYFEWLYGRICVVKLKNPTRTYWKLFKNLFSKEFVWIIPNDDNRVADGKDLRLEFLRDKGIDCQDKDWLEMGCCMLEMFLAVARHAAFETSSDPEEWFWEILENLKLNEYNDRAYSDLNKIDETLDRVIWRTYSRNGRGGMFPLAHPAKDQRDVEIWYQLCAYILERT